MEMKIKGLIVDKDSKVKFIIVKYFYNEAVYTVSQLKKQMDVYKADGVEIRDGVLTFTTKFQKYQLEGLEKVEAIMNTLESNPELKKKLAGIDEETVELSVSNNNICVLKSFKDDDFFTDYDYQSNGYNDAQFIGWNTIPDIVAPYLNGIVTKDKISCGGGEKLWYSVEIYCNQFAKLVPLKS